MEILIRIWNWIKDKPEHVISVVALIFVGIQVGLQTEQHHFENRPYIYAELELVPLSFSISEKGKPIFGGGNLHIRNIGKLPANILSIRPFVGSDLRPDSGIEKWFNKDYSPDFATKVLFPNQKDAVFPCHPIISRKHNRTLLPKLIFVGATIEYTGSDPKRIFWYYFSKVLIIHGEDVENKDGKGFEITISEYENRDEWDNHTANGVPELGPPDWDEILKKKYVKDKTKDIDLNDYQFIIYDSKRLGHYEIDKPVKVDLEEWLADENKILSVNNKCFFHQF